MGEQKPGKSTERCGAQVALFRSCHVEVLFLDVDGVLHPVQVGAGLTMQGEFDHDRLDTHGSSLPMDAWPGARSEKALQKRLVLISRFNQFHEVPVWI